MCMHAKIGRGSNFQEIGKLSMMDSVLLKIELMHVTKICNWNMNLNDGGGKRKQIGRRFFCRFISLTSWWKFQSFSFLCKLIMANATWKFCHGFLNNETPKAIIKLAFAFSWISIIVFKTALHSITMYRRGKHRKKSNSGPCMNLAWY